MVSEQNKKRLRDAAQKTGELVTRAGRAGSDALAREIKQRAERERQRAEDVDHNAEPNDRQDDQLVRQVRRNHEEVMAQLEAIQDELARPMDRNASVERMGGGLGFNDEEDDDDMDWTGFL
mgnify:CR=1 FL=1